MIGTMRMSGKTITRVELSKAVYRTKVGLTRTESSALLDLVLKEITNTIARGETVKLTSFGTFTVPKTRQRIGRTPKTGVELSAPRGSFQGFGENKAENPRQQHIRHAKRNDRTGLTAVIILRRARSLPEPTFRYWDQG
jgi:integration host factor subunit alpha